MDHEVTHTGIIDRIEDNKIFVRILQQSACAGCHAQSMCSAAESKNKIIEITDNSGKFGLNEEVLISGTSSLGLRAVFLAFVLPLIFIILILITGNSLHWNDGVLALAALFTLIPYYTLLYFCREGLKKRFIFTLKKLNQ